MNSNNTNGGAKSGLSKSQKKRMKRNAAKNRKQEEAKKVDQSSSIDETALNPHDKLRADLVNLGFQLSEIDTVLEEMWNLSLQYDEVDSVLAYIQQRSSSAELAAVATTTTNTSTTTTTPTDTQTMVEQKSLVEQHEEGATSSIGIATTSSSISNSMPTNNDTTPVTVEPITNEDKIQDVISATQEEKNSTYVEPSNIVDHVVSADNSVEDSSKASKAGSDLHSKLDMVANHDSLADAIMALTDWVVKAATAVEVKDFCSSSALHTVISRSISTQENLIGQLLDLIGSILRSLGVPATNLSSSAKALGSVIMKARTAIQSNGSSLNNNIATTIADIVVSRMAKTVDKIFSASQNGDAVAQRLKEEVEAMTSNVVNVGGVRELMSKRDFHQSAAEKYSTIAGIMIGMIPEENGGTTMNGSRSLNGSSGMDENYMACLLGQQYEEVNASKAKYDSLKDNLQQSNSSYVVERDSLSGEIENLTAEKGSTTKRIEELRAELQRLTSHEDALDAKIADARNKKSSLEQSLSGSARETEELLRKYAEKVKVGESISEVADGLNDFVTTLSDTQEKCASSTAAPSVAESIANATSSMESFLLRMKSYFESELNMVQFLRNRAMTLEEKATSLEREITECTMLGMSSNVSQMVKTLKETQQHLHDDNTVADALKGEAMKMTQNLTDQLNQYRSMMEKVGTSASAPVGSILNDIKKTIDGLGLPKDSLFMALINSFTLSVNGYDDHFHQNSSMLMGNGSNGHAETQISGHIIMEPRTETVEVKRPAPPASPRKLGWGNGRSTGKTPTKSLLDIQKEESSINSGN